MLAAVSLLTLYSAAGAAEDLDYWPGRGRLVGGLPAQFGEYPSMLSLEAMIPEGYDRDYVSLCGAVIISARWALTSAYCFHAIEGVNLVLRAGSATDRFGGVTCTVVEVIKHPSYEQVKFKPRHRYPIHDIAVVRVTPEFPLNGGTIQPARLTDPVRDPLSGASGVVLGWGRVSESGELPNTLHVVPVDIIDNESCQSLYRGFVIIQENLCTRSPNRGFCDGDYGGPLFVDGVVVGIASWSLGCADPLFADVYTRVSAYRNWIHAKTGV